VSWLLLVNVGLCIIIYILLWLGRVVEFVYFISYLFVWSLGF
jgi:hypothetical protein